MPTLAEQRKQDEKDRKRTARATRKEVLALLSNVEGIRRLRAISDEEWAGAVAEGDSAA